MPKKSKEPDERLKIQYIAGAFVEYQRLIQRTDNKANIVLVLIGVMTSLFFNFFITEKGALTAQIYIVLGPFILAGFFAFLALYPSAPRKSGNSLLYFKDCGSKSPEEIVKILTTVSEKDIYLDYAKNNRALAKSLSKKYVYLRNAYIFVGIAIGCKIIFELSLWLGFL